MLGRTLSHYQVLAILGQGGMGEVYKARDTRLNRFVALKVLKAELLSNAARKQRFVQEAQAASALNHPNIVTVHDVFEHEGIDCLVMEYIDGKTLDALIPHQGIRLNEALRIAVQIAEGLRKAHSAGIIHRDIKPSNIIVANDGPVKILDFGLAKLTESGASASDEDTRTQRPDTEEGTVMGTVAYMSPEQAEGTKVDVRSDIFSFGALLYEIITGRRAFPGNSKLSTMSAILKEEPKPVENVPPDLEKIIRRCLRKDRDKRYQHMDDLKLALEEVREESESRKIQPARITAQRSRIGYGEAAIGVLLAAGIAVAVATGTFFYYWRTRHAAQVATSYSLKQITADSGFSTTPAISPDGRLIAYASDRQSGNLDIWVQPLTVNARPIRLTSHSADDLSPSFSPDSGTIVFVSRRDGGGIYTVPALGGEERLVSKLASLTAAPRFSPDGMWIAFASGGTMLPSQTVIIPAGGGPRKVVGTDLAWAIRPVWSPDGKYLAVDARKTLDAAREYWVVPIDGSPASPTGTLVVGELDDWVPGFLTYSIGSAAWALPFADGSWKTGTASKLMESTAALRFSRAIGARSGLPNRVVFAAESATEHLWSLALDSNTASSKGEPIRLAHSGGSQFMPSIDSAGRFLIYTQQVPGREEVRILEFDSGKDTALFHGYARAKISPDGSRIVYRDTSGVYATDRSGGETIKLLDQNSNLNSNIYGWHKEGIIYWQGLPLQTFLLDPETKRLRELISHPTVSIHGAELSPDGKWLSFHVVGPLLEPLYVAPIQNGKAPAQSQWILITESMGLNRRGWWSADGNTLYWMSERDGPMAIWAQRLSKDKHPQGSPFAVLRFQETRLSPYNAGFARFGPAVAPDRIIYALLEKSGNIWLAEANK